MDIQNKALALGLTGWVRNRNDGRVEAVFEGPQSGVHDMVDWVQQGPVMAYVMHVDTDYLQCRNEFAAFEVV